MSQVEGTHLNAYMAELAEAENQALQVAGRIANLKRQIDAKRAEQGLKPLYDSDGKKKKTPKEPTPPGADGFGVSTPKVDKDGNA